MHEGRLGAALFSPDRVLNRSIRISRDTGRTFAGDYEVLLSAIGGTSQPLLAGWWESWADEVGGLFRTPGERVTLWEGSDLDWLVWETDWATVSDVMDQSGLEPGVLATRLLGWVLVSPPSSSDMFLYPEISASGE